MALLRARSLGEGLGLGLGSGWDEFLSELLRARGPGQHSNAVFKEAKEVVVANRRGRRQGGPNGTPRGEGGDATCRRWLARAALSGCCGYG